MTEQNYMKKVQLAAPHHGVMLYRNNVGVCRAADGRVVRFGLCKGSSDLIGWHTREITEDDVGRTLAVFTAVETKTRNGTLRPEQAAFLAAVERDGGRALVLREGDDIAEALCG